MFQSIHAIKKIGFLFAIMTLWSCSAVSQQQQAPAIDGKAVAEKFVRPQNGVAAIVFDANGRAVVVNKNGKVVTPCQLCTPELERKYGPQCAKLTKPGEDNAISPPVCTKLINTTVQSVQSISIIRHTGSTCWTVVNIDGPNLAFPDCD